MATDAAAEASEIAKYTSPPTNAAARVSGAHVLVAEPWAKSNATIAATAARTAAQWL
jgi:hypothetical protein